MIFKQLKGWTETKQLSFLLQELVRLKDKGDLRSEIHQEILARLESEKEKSESELAQLRKQSKLRLGRRLLLFFGSVAFAIGLGFFIYDHYEWFRGIFDFFQQLEKWFLRMSAPVRAVELIAVTALLFWGTLRQKDQLEKSSRLFAYLGLSVLIVFDSFKIPDWLLGGSYTHWERLLAGLLLFGWGYYTSFRTIVYASLFLICGWLGGGAAYGFACYFIWMKDPLLFLPFSISLRQKDIGDKKSRGDVPGVGEKVSKIGRIALRGSSDKSDGAQRRRDKTRPRDERWNGSSRQKIIIRRFLGPARRPKPNP